jgi:chromate transporter
MQAGEASSAAPEVVPCSLRDLTTYFLRLGTVGFGGPIALAGYMQRDLVDHRRWISKQNYVEGLALAQLSPGPLAAQLAMYLGWVRGGAAGAALVGTAFVLPSFLMVVALALLYIRFGGLPWMQGIFYGVGAAVIAIIARSTAKLTRLTLARDPLLWGAFAVTAVVTAIRESEIVGLFIACGAVTMLVKAPPRIGDGKAAGLLPLLLTGMHGAAPPTSVAQLAWFFTKAGAFVFGSGLAIVPFLYKGVVHDFQWLDDRQFRDAVAVAMITPGPVVITAGFIGYLAAGVCGAFVAAAGTFVPPYLVVVLAARYVRKASSHPTLKAFVGGVTASATGAIAGAVFILGRRALVDLATVGIGAATLATLFKTKRLAEPVLIALAGAVGLLLKRP